jgi:hypothetical protein
MGKMPSGAASPKPIVEEKAAVNTTSATYVSAPQAPRQVASPAPVAAPVVAPVAAPASPTPPAKPVRPASVTKPPKPSKTGDIPSLQDMSLQDAPVAPQYSPAKPTSAPPPLPSSPPPPVPTSAPPPLPSFAPPPQPPVATGDAEDTAPAAVSVTPTRRGSVGEYASYPLYTSSEV